MQRSSCGAGSTPHRTRSARPTWPGWLPHWCWRVPSDRLQPARPCPSDRTSGVRSAANRRRQSSRPRLRPMGWTGVRRCPTAVGQRRCRPRRQGRRPRRETGALCPRRPSRPSGTGPVVLVSHDAANRALLLLDSEPEAPGGSASTPPAGTSSRAVRPAGTSARSTGFPQTSTGCARPWLPQITRPPGADVLLPSSGRTRDGQHRPSAAADNFRGCRFLEVSFRVR